MRKNGRFGTVAVLSALVVALAVLNVAQLALTPRQAAGEDGPASDVSKYRGGERAEMTDALKALDETSKAVLEEIKGLRADVTGGKVQVQVVTPPQE
jgi:hypothetical protein